MVAEKGRLMLEHFLDPGFLQGLAAFLGPIAVLIAPTEEIEAMIFDGYGAEVEEEVVIDTVEIANEDGPGPLSHRDAA